LRSEETQHISSTVAQRRDPAYLAAEQPSFFLSGPWSNNWTPENTSVPCHVQWVVSKHRAQKAPAIEGSQQGQITKKGIRLDFY